MPTSEEMLEVASDLEKDHRDLMRLANCTAPNVTTPASRAAAMLRQIADEREAEESVADFGKSMIRLTPEFEAAIFENLEGLYEK